MARASCKADNNNLVRKALLKNCMDLITNNKYLEVLKIAVQEKGLNLKEISNSKTLRDFDTRFTAKMVDLTNCDEYYNSISGHKRLEYVSIPVLSISSRHDPVVENSGFEAAKVMANANIFQVIVNNGGHVEYSHGWSNRHWAVAAGLDYLIMVDQGKIVAL